MDNLWKFDEANGQDDDRNSISGRERCIGIECYIWFHLVKSLWKKHRSFFNKHLRYVTNDIHKPFKVTILYYSEHINEIFELD